MNCQLLQRQRQNPESSVVSVEVVDITFVWLLEPGGSVVSVEVLDGAFL
jgi:hypothetical protein